MLTVWQSKSAKRVRIPVQFIHLCVNPLQRHETMCSPSSSYRLIIELPRIFILICRLAYQKHNWQPKDGCVGTLQVIICTSFFFYSEKYGCFYTCLRHYNQIIPAEKSCSSVHCVEISGSKSSMATSLGDGKLRIRISLVHGTSKTIP